jgi:hypothetical protein
MVGPRTTALSKRVKEFFQEVTCKGIAADFTLPRAALDK